MKLDFNLDFLYYQGELILDGRDEKKEELRPDSIKFKKYVKETSIENLVELLILSYAKRYANDIYWSTRFIGDLDNNISYPEELNEDIDFYLEEKEISKEGITKVVFKKYDDIDKNCYYTEWMYFEFTDQHNINNLLEPIKKGLQNVTYSQRQESSDVIIEPKDSAILKITVSSSSLRVDLNPDKWKVYRGF
ncbi:hypothetical protein [Tenacibaculum sp.]|uniref:hypothetical protein n=1 Tax=Tenacibaculum sp. TaxID=1906242 RepID=UPI003D0B786D